jgi:hypothetical protein
MPSLWMACLYLAHAHSAACTDHCDGLPDQAALCLLQASFLKRQPDQGSEGASCSLTGESAADVMGAGSYIRSHCDADDAADWGDTSGILAVPICAAGRTLT